MVKKRDYNQRSTNSAGGTSASYQSRAKTGDQSSYKGKSNSYGRNNSNRQDNSNRQNNSGRYSNSNRQNDSNRFNSTRYSRRIKAEETVEDIKTDINRIEKEIELELKEIRSMKL